jgi:hypothetical protein
MKTPFERTNAFQNLFEGGYSKIEYVYIIIFKI